MLFQNLDGAGFGCHRSYILACDDSSVLSGDQIFNSREAAKQKMYKLMLKHSLVSTEIYEDNHDITYVCNKNVKFYISRMF